MFKILFDSLRTGIVTERHALDDRPPFGFPVIDFPRCTACEDCARACPTGAIRTHEGDAGARMLTLSYSSCIQCRACVEACGPTAITPGRAELVAFTRDQLAQTARFEPGPAGAWTFRGIEIQPGPGLEQSGARLRERIGSQFGRSLHVRQVDAGSCNGCEMEIAAAANPVFDLERFGIHFVASPRHADVLLVTGPVTRNMEIALHRTYEAAPDPRVVVAVGACGCSGGLFGEGTYAAVGGVDRVVPVDVYIPGCPPRPQAVLNGLLVAMGIRAARAGDLNRS